jgi:hypothetical protein
VEKNSFAACHQCKVAWWVAYKLYTVEDGASTSVDELNMNFERVDAPHVGD